MQQNAEPVQLLKAHRLIELAYIRELTTLLSAALFCAMSFLQKRSPPGKK